MASVKKLETATSVGAEMILTLALGTAVSATVILTLALGTAVSATAINPLPKISTAASNISSAHLQNRGPRLRGLNITLPDSSAMASSTPMQIDRTSLFVELREAKEKCSIDGWDSPTSKAVSNAVFTMAEEVISLLPAGLPNPEMTPENDGVLGFEWENNNDYYDVVITPERTLHYIVNIKGQKSRGFFNHDSTKLPSAMVVFLKDLYSLSSVV